MIDECSDVPLRREPRVSNPPLRLIPPFWGRILQPIASLDLPNNNQITSIGCPIGEFHVFKNFSRSAATQRHAGECSAEKKRLHGSTVEQQCHFARRRYGKDVCPGRIQVTRLWTVWPSCKHLRRLTFPRCTVNDRLAVRRKAGRMYSTPSEAQRMVNRERSLSMALEQEHASSKASRQSQDGSKEDRADVAALRSSRLRLGRERCNCF